MSTLAEISRMRWIKHAQLMVSFAAVLAVGFAGYLHPDMRLDWAALAQLCGLR